MLEPKTITLKDQKGAERDFIIHKVPAIPMREIVAKYPVANLPKIGDYGVSEEVMLKLISFVSVPTPNGSLALSTMALVNNHVPDWELLAKLEAAMLEYNVSFFGNVKNFASWQDSLKTYLPKILSMLTDLSQPSSQTGKQPSKN